MNIKLIKIFEICEILSMNMASEENTSRAIRIMQGLLSDIFHAEHPRTELSDNHKNFIRNSIFEYINAYRENPVNMNNLRLHVSFHNDIEHEYSQYLRLQPNFTILEMPSNMGAVLSGRRVFWMVFDRHIYQMETTTMIDRCTNVVRRF